MEEILKQRLVTLKQEAKEIEDNIKKLEQDYTTIGKMLNEHKQLVYVYSGGIETIQGILKGLEVDETKTSEKGREEGKD